jgi:tRNA(adenine34) deaminase
MSTKSTSKRTSRKRKWSRKIKTDSTFPPRGLFTKDAETIARRMASKKVSPKGIGSGIKMVQMFINRAGKNLDSGQKKELEKAKRLLQEKNRRQKAQEE